MRTISRTTWPVEDAQAYIMDRVHQVPWSGCWLWERSVDRYGYGMCHPPLKTTVGKRLAIKAHRLAYEAFRGPIQTGAGYHGTCVMHACDVPACCNPDHLRVGTNQDNVDDKMAKGRNNPTRGERSGNAKLTEEAVREIRGSSEPLATLAAKHGVSKQTIARAIAGERWAHVEVPSLAVDRAARGERNHNSKLTTKSAAEIFRRAGEGEQQRALAREFGVSDNQVSQICRGAAWAHVTGATRRAKVRRSR